MKREVLVEMAKRALVVIDVQKVYTDPESETYAPDSAGTIKRINDLINLFKAKKLPIVYVRHAHKSDGSDAGRLFDFAGEEEEVGFIEGTDDVEFDNRLIVERSAPIITKNRYSAFKNTKLHAILKRMGVERVVICGFMTNFCCESTAREALDLDYFVDFVVDATGTPGTDGMRENQVRKVVAELLGAGFARVYQAKQYLKLDD